MYPSLEYRHRLRLGPPFSSNASFQPEAMGWRVVKTPGDLVFLLLGVLLTLLALRSLFWLWGVLVGSVSGRPTLVSLLVGLPAILSVVIPVHELLHGLPLPGGGRSPATTFGVWPARFMFYVHHDGVVPRNRWLLSLVAPFVVLSVGPVVLGALLHQGHWVLLAVAGLNALLGGTDLLVALIVVAQVPSAAVVRPRDEQLWWGERTQPTRPVSMPKSQ
jgi:hypothetical protein